MKNDIYAKMLVTGTIAKQAGKDISNYTGSRQEPMCLRDKKGRKG